MTATPLAGVTTSDGLSCTQYYFGEPFAHLDCTPFTGGYDNGMSLTALAARRQRSTPPRES